MKTNSLKINAILNIIRSITKILFPLITYKYVSGILQVDNLGRYNFSASIVSYFSFIAALGVNAYSIRTGVAYRNKRDELEKFVSEIFTINMLSTLVAYIILGFVLLFFNKDNYMILIIILSTQIMFSTIGVEWLYSIMEDYVYITIRTVVFQFVSLIVMFIFVKNINDTNVYAAITVLAMAGSNVLNFLHARNYCKIRLTRFPNFKKHFLPILIIFAQNISVLIFVNSDMIFLGLLSGDYNVGLYSVASNIYKGMKTMISAIIVVSIPRLSFYIANNERQNFIATLQKLFSVLVTFLAPLIVVVVSLSEELILVLSDNTFLGASNSLKLLSIATLFSMFSYVYGQCILIPLRREKLLLVATIISAIVNILLNFCFIPCLEQDGAAITTIISEAIVFFICWRKIHNDVKVCTNKMELIKLLFGSIVIYIVCENLKPLFTNTYLKVCICLFVSGLVYYLIEVLLKNNLIMDYSIRIKNKIKSYRE